jgi:preprotein translocase subunit SecA
MKWADMPEDMPIEHGMISKSIQQAQVRVEGHNFDIRKRVLEYDDVVNKQRETIYAQRRRILNAAPGELREQIQRLITEQIQAACAQHLGRDTYEWDLAELHRAVLSIYPVPADITPETLAQHQDDEAVELALVKGALRVYEERIQQYGADWMSDAEKFVMLAAVDQLWQRHLTDLDVLREGIGLVGYGGRDPLVEYQRQSFEMWTALQDEIKTKVVQDIYRVAPREQQQRLPTQIRLSNIQASRRALTAAMVAGTAREDPPQPTRSVGMYDNVGRNDPCPCGSGKKFKHCHYREMQGQRSTVGQDEVKRSVRRKR